MNRRTFLKSTAVSGAALLGGFSNAEAALPTAKITRIRLYQAPTVMPLQIPLLQSNMVVIVETDANITGIGEGGTLDTLLPCAGRLIGKNPFHTERCWQDMYRAFHYPPGRERLHAIGALDLALWDLKAKAMDVPVHELLGGMNRNYLECYTTTFRGGGNTIRDRAAACMDAGWRLFRFDAASLPQGSTSYDTRERIRQVQADCRAAREGVGPSGNFMVDFHQRFNFSDALRGCKLIEEFEPYLVEDPVQTDAFLQDIPKLRSQTSVPLAAGEEWGARWDFNRLVENHDLDFVRCSLPNVGGITELIRICAMCETHEVGIVPHFTGPIATAAQIHALGPYPYPVVFEYNYAQPIPYLNEFVTFREGKLYANNRPGLGVTLKMDQLKLVATISDPGPNRPTYYRPDGSQNHLVATYLVSTAPLQLQWRRMLQDAARNDVRGARETLTELLARLRGSQAYRNYELTRERVFDMKDRANRPTNTDAPSKYWTFELANFDYMIDASPVVIDKLRHHCYHLTGVRPYETHRAAKPEQLESFYAKLEMLYALGSRELLVPEAPILGGFGYNVDGGMVNVDTMKYFEVALALERAGALARLKAVERPIVCEIGPGWGGFAYAFKRIVPQATVILVDLPESFLFSATYLMTAFPQARVVFWGDDGAAEALQSANPPDFLFVSHAEIAQVRPPRLDATINMVSFQEMRADQVRGYVHWAADHNSGCLYSLNRDRSPYNDEIVSVRELMGERFETRQIEMLPWSYSKFVHPKKIGGKGSVKLADNPEPGLDYRHIFGEPRNR